MIAWLATYRDRIGLLLLTAGATVALLTAAVR